MLRLKNSVKGTKSFILKYPDYTHKSNTIVILNLDDYKNKMNVILDTYIKINKDSTNKMKTDLSTLLMKWKKQRIYRSETTHTTNYIDQMKICQGYSLPKIHNEDNPLRLIINCINSPIFPLVTYIKDIL